MRRGFVRKGARRPANVQWSSIASQFLMAGVTQTSSQVLIELQSPAALNALTSDPPEDLTLLRLVGSFELAITNPAGSWVLALTVQDTTWTPGATVSVDADKRLLWSRNFDSGANTITVLWTPPDRCWSTDAAGTFQSHSTAMQVDIAPKVRIQPGQALYLVAYEESGASTLTMTSSLMRVLYKRSGRR